MNLPFKYIALSVTISLLSGCYSAAPDLENIPEAELYQKAETELQTGYVRTAIAELEELDKTYPFGPYSQQVQLNLIYAYYKSGDLPVAIASIDRFIKLNPTHPNIDWVIYMRGLVNMAQDENQVQGWFNIDRSDRDLDFSTAAFKDFTYLVASYPYSAYSYDAEQRLIYLKNKFATHQLRIAQYYSERTAYVAVINRIKEMLKMFPDTDATKEALPLMKNAYTQLGLTTDAQKVEQLIQANVGNMSNKQVEDKKFLGIF